MHGLMRKLTHVHLRRTYDARPLSTTEQKPIQPVVCGSSSGEFTARGCTQIRGRTRTCAHDDDGGDVLVRLGARRVTKRTGVGTPAHSACQDVRAACLMACSAFCVPSPVGG
jgi:hypothetical protein